MSFNFDLWKHPYHPADPEIKCAACGHDFGFDGHACTKEAPLIRYNPYQEDCKFFCLPCFVNFLTLAQYESPLRTGIALDAPKVFAVKDGSEN